MRGAGCTAVDSAQFSSLAYSFFPALTDSSSQSGQSDFHLQNPINAARGQGQHPHVGTGHP
jgi:hypothetical protein